MMKKALTMLLVLSLGLTATACVHYSNQHYYEQAQLCVGSGEYARAAELFGLLGEYRDSADYALYAAALNALSEGDLTLARTNLNAVAPFKSSERYLTWIGALEKEASGDLAGALAVYETLGTFHNAHEAAEALRTAIPEEAIRQGRAMMARGEYAAARELFLSLEGYGQSETLAENCTVAINRAAYTAADKLYDAGDVHAARQAFLALGDVLDAADRAAQCREEIIADLNARTEAVTLGTANGLIAEWESLDDEEALAQAAALRERFGVNLQLLSVADTQPCVLLGEYPMGESGLESDVMWRVIAVNGAQITLLCESVIDASAIATTTDLVPTDDALSAMSLPSAADLASLSDLSCSATPYAVAQGVTQEGGVALYWLRDSLENGVHPVVSAAGSLTLPTDATIPGVRPLLTVSLEEHVFTAGDGTPENPFR